MKSFNTFAFTVTQIPFTMNHRPHKETLARKVHQIVSLKMAKIFRNIV